MLDTHTFLWWDSEPSKLSARVLALCQDPTVILFLSLVSLWEMQIKSSLGKLPLPMPLPQTLPMPLPQIVADQQKQGLRLLPITLNHILALDSLPHHHKDPFDRLLLAQAQVEGMTLASMDHVFASYPISLVW